MNDASSAESESEKKDDTTCADEVEPKLKYARLSNDLHNIMRKDAINCVAFHPKIICMGTRWGVVHLFDHQGNIIQNNNLRAHTVAVNQISMDAKGDFIATCSDDGKAYTYGLYTTDHTLEVDLGRSIKSVAIDPLYYKMGANRRFITGDERLMLHEKTFLSRVKSTLLYDAIGPVHAVRWHGRFVAWACDVGVRVYDIGERRSLALIKWDRAERLSPERQTPDRFPCSLCWKNASTLLVGWVDTVRVCKVERRVSVIRDLPEFAVTPVSTFKIDYYISGVCPLEQTQLVILACPKEKDEDGKALRPQMYILQAEDSKYAEVYTDNLAMRGYQLYSCADYRLECLQSESCFIVICPKDVVVASAFDTDDRVTWLVDHKQFEKALELVESGFVKHNSRLSVGKRYIDYLLARGESTKAAQMCPKIFGNKKELWEIGVFKFARVQQLRAISEYLPTGVNDKLNAEIYEIVLFEYLKTDHAGFLRLVQNWRPDLYHVESQINAVIKDHGPAFPPLLAESLAILYTHVGYYDMAFTFYLQLQHSSVFDLVTKYGLYNKMIDNIEKLMKLDTSRALSVLLEKDKAQEKYKLAPDVIVEHLKHNEYYLYLYLDALDNRNLKSISKRYHGLLVKLYANFEQKKLLPLLRRSDSYPIQEALAICKERDLYEATVYLLGRIGNTKEALGLLIGRIGDMEQAIAFCKEHDDPELWIALVEHSLSRPDFVTYLLQKIGTYVDPRILIQRIDDRMEIPGLRNSLAKMMRDYGLQVSVQEGFKNIVVSDCFDLHDRLVEMQRRGLVVDDDAKCSVCDQKVLMSNTTKKNVLMFCCRHSFHEECLPASGKTEKCVICYSQKMTPPVSGFA